MDRSLPTAAPPPVITVGVPVLNGERYLAEALGCLADQSLTDFEVVISDNASTDGTPEIIRTFTGRDSRFVSVRSEQRLSLADNWNRTLNLARGEFFTWNAADDRARPGHLLAGVSALQAHPEASVAFPRVGRIDAGGNPLPPRDDADLDFLHRTPDQRVRLFFERRVYQVVGFGGVMRTAQLRRFGGHPQEWGGDFTLAVRMALDSPWVQVPETLYEERVHDRRLSHVQRGELSAQLKLVQPDRDARLAFPEWASSWLLYAAVFGAPVRWDVRARAAWAIASTRTIPEWRLLALDIKRNLAFLRGQSRKALAHLSSTSSV